MTILKTHHCDGTAGTNPSTASEGAAIVNTPTSLIYANGGFLNGYIDIASGASGYIQDSEATGQYMGGYFNVGASLPSGDQTICTCTVSGTASGSWRINSSGKVTLYSGLVTLQATSVLTLSVNTWYRFEWHTDGPTTTSELRLFSPATEVTPTDILTGILSSSTQTNQQRFGHPQAGNIAGEIQLDELVTADAWPNLGVAPAMTFVKTVTIG